VLFGPAEEAAYGLIEGRQVAFKMPAQALFDARVNVLVEAPRAFLF
jgi:hypothetical protein